MSDQDADGGKTADVSILEPKTFQEHDESSKEVARKRSRSPNLMSYSSDKKITDAPGGKTVNKMKNSISKTLSSTTKKNPAEDIPMTSLDFEQKKGEAIPPQLAQISPVLPVPIPKDETSALQEQIQPAKLPEEEVTDDITELQSERAEEWVEDEEAGGLPRTSSRWDLSRMVRDLFCCGVRYEPPDEDTISYHRGYGVQHGDTAASGLSSSRAVKITWNDNDYLDKVHLKPIAGTARALALERKASVGPLKSSTPFARASGLAICVPKKSTKNLHSRDNEAALGINISISKKCIPKRCKGVVIRHSSADIAQGGDMVRHEEKRAVKVDVEVPYLKMFSALRNKIDAVRNKFHTIRNFTSS